MHFTNEATAPIPKIKEGKKLTKKNKGEWK